MNTYIAAIAPYRREAISSMAVGNLTRFAPFWNSQFLPKTEENLAFLALCKGTRQLELTFESGSHRHWDDDIAKDLPGIVSKIVSYLPRLRELKIAEGWIGSDRYVEMTQNSCTVSLGHTGFSSLLSISIDGRIESQLEADPIARSLIEEHYSALGGQLGHPRDFDLSKDLIMRIRIEDIFNTLPLDVQEEGPYGFLPKPTRQAYQISHACGSLLVRGQTTRPKRVYNISHACGSLYFGGQKTQPKQRQQKSMSAEGNHSNPLI